MAQPGKANQRCWQQQGWRDTETLACGAGQGVESAYADDVLCCRFRAADGKEGLPGQALLHLQGHPTSMACGCPTGPDRGEAHLNSRFANVKSLKQSRRLKPRPGHPSACLTGPMGALVRWRIQQIRLFQMLSNSFLLTTRTGQ